MSDQDRVRALKSYGVLDTDPEPSFQTVTNTAAIAFGVPIAAVSLIDEERQWFKARHGLKVCETAREVSFCTHAILQEDFFIVPDTRLDPRFRDNPLVTGEPHLRFYAGAPLIDDEGWALGTFCIMDTAPRLLSDDEMTMLSGFARFALTALTAHKLTAERARGAKED